jgi:hypothetical protein
VFATQVFLALFIVVIVIFVYETPDISAAQESRTQRAFLASTNESLHERTSGNPLVAALDFDCKRRTPGSCPPFPKTPDLEPWGDVLFCDAPFISGIDRAFNPCCVGFMPMRCT